MLHRYSYRHATSTLQLQAPGVFHGMEGFLESSSYRLTDKHLISYTLRNSCSGIFAILKGQLQCSFKILLIKNSVIPIKRQPFWYLQINFNNYTYLQVIFTLMVKKIQINKSNYSNKKTPEKIEEWWSRTTKHREIHVREVQSSNDLKSLISNVS